MLVERYDRAWSPDSPGGPPRLRRLHQEDFCQALGIVSENKYQNEGGPSLKQCFNLLREASSAPAVDLQAFLDAVIFNWLTGNHDAHGKNFSLLYGGEVNSGVQIRLAPLYDLISTVYYPELSPKMAMKIGSAYLSESVLPRDFEQMATEAGLAKPLVRRRVPEVAEAILSRLPDVTTEHPVSLSVNKLLRSRCERLMRTF